MVIFIFPAVAGLVYSYSSLGGTGLWILWVIGAALTAVSFVYWIFFLFYPAAVMHTVGEDNPKK